jgi:hypothetical protein
LKSISFAFLNYQLIFFKLPANRYLAINIEGKIEKPEILIKKRFKERHEVPKGVIRNRNTKKDRQHNGQAINGQKDVRC